MFKRVSKQKGCYQLIFLGILTYISAVSANTPTTTTSLATVSAASESDLTHIPLPETTAPRHKILTLEDAILLALRNNPNVYNSQLQRINDKYALELANYAFEPHFQIGGSASYTQANQITPASQRPTYALAPNVTWNSKIGTQLSATYNSALLDSPANEEISVTQPLLQGFGYVNRIPLYNAEDQEKINKLTFKQSVIDVVTQVTQSFRQLVQSYNQLDMQEQTLKRKEQMVAQYRLQVKTGQIAPADLLQQQSDLASTRLETNQQINDIQQQYQLFLNTLGLSPHAQLSIDKVINTEDYQLPDQDTAIALAFRGNTTYLSAVLSLRATRRAVIQAEDQRRWQLDASASVTLGGGIQDSEATSPTGGVQATSGPTYGLSLNIPINDLTTKANLVSARVALEQAQAQLDQTRRDLASQVITALTNLRYQQQRIQLAAEAVRLQQLTVDAERIKNKYGQSTVFELNQIEDQLLNQQMNLISAKIEYLNAISDFEQLLGTTLDYWHIQMRYNA